MCLNLAADALSYNLGDPLSPFCLAQFWGAMGEPVAGGAPGALKSFLRWNLVQSVGQSMKARCDCAVGNSSTGDAEGFPQEYTPLLGSMARWAALRPGITDIDMFVCT